jgi:hypothetical protein
MSIEDERLAGFRHVHNMYLVSHKNITLKCDRFPLEVSFCPTCGSGIKFSRGLALINPVKLLGEHKSCTCPSTCPVCHPKNTTAFTTGIGGKFYDRLDSFVREATDIGVSKTVHNIPRTLTLNKTGVYVIYRDVNALTLDSQQNMNHNKHESFYIVAYFIPEALEYLMWESEINDRTKSSAERRHITIIPVPDGDKDHMPRTRHNHALVE